VHLFWSASQDASLHPVPFLDGSLRHGSSFLIHERGTLFSA
jgi:hypothetical protein